MSERFESRSEVDAELLGDAQLDAVIGGNEGYPGLPLGTNIIVSPWSSGAFGAKWNLVGATGHL